MNSKDSMTWFYLFLVAIIIALAFTANQSSAVTEIDEAQANMDRLWTLQAGAAWLGSEYTYNPCTIIENGFDEIWGNPAYADTDIFYDFELTDWDNRLKWQLYLHGPRDFVIVWGTYVFGPDGNPHPVAVYFVDCDIKPPGELHTQGELTNASSNHFVAGGIVSIRM